MPDNQIVVDAFNTLSRTVLPMIQDHRRFYHSDLLIDAEACARLCDGESYTLLVRAAGTTRLGNSARYIHLTDAIDSLDATYTPDGKLVSGDGIGIVEVTASGLGRFAARVLLSRNPAVEGAVKIADLVTPCHNEPVVVYDPVDLRGIPVMPARPTAQPTDAKPDTQLFDTKDVAVMAFQMLGGKGDE